MVTQLPLPQKGAQPPQFLALVCCCQMAGWIKMPLATMVCLSLGNIVLDADPAPPQGAQPLQFSAHICCGQLAGWIKMPLGMEVGLGPDRNVLDGDPAPLSPKRGRSPEIFGPCLLWPNG